MEKREIKKRKIIKGCCLLIAMICCISLLSFILIPNKNDKGTIQIYCVDSIKKQLRPNVFVSLYSEDGYLIDSKASNEKGEITWDYVSYGKYYVMLSQKEAHYTSESKQIQVRLDNDMAHYIMDVIKQEEG